MNRFQWFLNVKLPQIGREFGKALSEMGRQVGNYIRFWKLRYRERGGVKKLYRCPRCHQVIRVPRGKGKIAIMCPKCRFEFIKRT